MTTEISVMYGSEKVNMLLWFDRKQDKLRDHWWSVD